MADEKLDPKALSKALEGAAKKATKPAKESEPVVEKVAPKDYVIAYNAAMDTSMVGTYLKIDGVTVHCENPVIWRGNLITKRDSAANTKLYAMEGIGVMISDIVVQISEEVARTLGAA